MTSLKTISVLLVVLLLAACGGGGGGGPPVERVYDDGSGPGERLGEASSFVHRATPANTVGNRTFLDHGYCNGDPDAILIVTQLYVPDPHMGFGVYNAHNIAVQYVPARAQWAILNTDMANVPNGAEFNVTAATGNIVGDTRFVSYVTTPENANEHFLILDHPRLNGRPGTPIFVTQNVSALGQSCRRSPFVPSVTYGPSLDRWILTNHPPGEAGRLEFDTGYNICIPESGAGNHFSEVNTQRTRATHLDGPSCRLDLSGTGTAIVHVTPVLFAGIGAPGTSYGNPYAVFFDAAHGWWHVMNEVSEVMRPDVLFFTGSARP